MKRAEGTPVNNMKTHTIPIKSGFDTSNLLHYLSSQVEPSVLKWDQENFFPIEVIKNLHDLGMFRGSAPEKFYGLALPMIDLMQLGSELAFYTPGLFSSWVANVFAQTAISRFAQKSCAETLFKRHFEEGSLFAVCTSEKESGSDVGQMRTTATQVEGGYWVDGAKFYITNVNYAAHLVVFAKVKSPRGELEKGFSAFYIPANQNGIKTGEPLLKLGHRESNTGQVGFFRVFVPEAHRLGAEGDGFKILSACVSRSKTLIAAGAVGICRRAEREAVAYLSRTERYGAALLAKKEIQAVLSEARTRVEAAWLLACRAGAVWDQMGDAVAEASMAKYYAADTAVSFVSEALELSGASGYMQGSFLSKLYRDAKLLEIYEGASLVQQALMGREFYGHYLKKIKTPLRAVS